MDNRKQYESHVIVIIISLSLPFSLFLVHYNGYLEYADEPYDSTRLRDKPLTIRLGTHQVIEGWVWLNQYN